MTTKTKNILNWVLAGLVAFIFIGSAIGKFTADETATAQSAQMGLNARTILYLGIIELVALALFLTPRTSIIGTLLLVAYMGGAIATHLEHNQPLMAPIIVSTFVWLVGFVRNPELSQRILNNNKNK